MLCAAALVLAALGGCATLQVDALRKSPPPPGVAPRIELAEAPFFPQEEYQCGPASLATALRHAGIGADPDQLVAQVYIPGRQGSLQAEMLAATRRHGVLGYVLAPRLESVLREISAGNAVVVFQNLAFDWVPLWHYAVAIGYDIERDEMVLRSGTTRRLVMTLSSFERTWARAGYWAMVVAPAGRLPATAEEKSYVSAAIALERVARDAAGRAYVTALERWPENVHARLGLGNVSYARGDFVAAETAFRRVVEAQPDLADGWNNLAMALFGLGRKTAAVDAARKAVSLGGSRIATYRETLREVGGLP